MRAVAPVFVLIALVLAGAGCGDDRADRRPGPLDGSALDFTSKATIVITESGIDPATLTVRVGDTITVENRGTRPDGLSSLSIDSGVLQPGETSTVFFGEERTIEVASHADPSH
ncbi:MAG: Cupredoxin-like domain, partial [Acidimicrobiaceae bacterium]